MSPTIDHMLNQQLCRNPSIFMLELNNNYSINIGYEFNYDEWWYKIMQWWSKKFGSSTICRLSEPAVVWRHNIEWLLMRSGCYKIYPLKDICKLPLENQHKHVVTSHTELSWEGTLILVMPKDHYYCHAQFSIEILKDFFNFWTRFSIIIFGLYKKCLDWLISVWGPTSVDKILIWTISLKLT